METGLIIFTALKNSNWDNNLYKSSFSGSGAVHNILCPFSMLSREDYTLFSLLTGKSEQVKILIS